MENGRIEKSNVHIVMVTTIVWIRSIVYWELNSGIEEWQMRANLFEKNS